MGNRETRNISLWRRANARNVRLYYLYRQYTHLFIFWFVSQHCLRSTLHYKHMYVIVYVWQIDSILTLSVQLSRRCGVSVQIIHKGLGVKCTSVDTNGCFLYWTVTTVIYWMKISLCHFWDVNETSKAISCKVLKHI